MKFIKSCRDFSTRLEMTKSKTMKKNIDRREFFKRAGAASIIMSGLAACKDSSTSLGMTDKTQSSEGEMTYIR